MFFVIFAYKSTIFIGSTKYSGEYFFVFYVFLTTEYFQNEKTFTIFAPKSKMFFMKSLFVAALLVCVINVYAQTDAAEAKLSPWLKLKVADASVAHGKAATRLLSNNVKESLDVLVKLADGADEPDEVLAGYGARVLNRIGRVLIVRLPLSQVTALARDQRVLRIEAERAPRPMLDRVPSQIGADKATANAGGQLPQAFTGKDVVVGVVDAGFDYIHPFLRDANGTTRVGWAADYLQGTTLTTTEAITSAQHSSDAATMLHGTHVAGIAAGREVNDVNDVVYSGIATEADIALAAVDTEISTDGTGLSSATSLRAFADIFDYADRQQKPCVINYSMGDAMSFADNRQLENEAIATLLEKPGRALVVAAGNAGGTTRLACKPGDMAIAGAGVCFNTYEQYGRYLGLELKLLPTQTVSLCYTDSVYKSVKGEVTVSAQELGTKSTLLMGGKRLTVVSRGQTADGYYVYYITAGRTTFTTGERVLVTISGEGGAWIYADPMCAQLDSADRLAANQAVIQEGASLTWPAELDQVIAVGNIAHRFKILTAVDKYSGRDSTDLTTYECTKGPGYLARSSSVGPSIDGRVKPDVCAPGVNVVSALNNFINEDTEMEYAGWLISHLDTEWEPNYGYSMTLAQTGTSMSAPAVSGTIALWMQADPTLTTDRIKDVIAHSSRQPDAELCYPNNWYGHGEIDAYQGLLYLLLTTDIKGLSRHQPADVKFRLQDRQLSLLFSGAPDDHFRVSIYSTDGKLLLTTADQASISLAHLPKGVYAVQLTTGHAQTTGSTLIRL